MDRARRLVAFFCMAVAPLAAIAQSAPQFTLFDLGLVSYPGQGIDPGLSTGAIAPPGGSPSYQNGRPSLGGSPPTNAIYAQFTNSLEVPAVGFSTVPSSGSGNPGYHAAFWNGDVVTDLGLLPGAVAQPGESGPESVAYYFNGNDDIVGVSDTAYPELGGAAGRIARHAFLYQSSTHALQDIGTLSDDNHSSTAYAINSADEIVGTSEAIATADGSVLQRAFLYTGGQLYNLSFNLLNAPTIRLTVAVGINCQGNITALGYDTNIGQSRPHSYLLIRQGTTRNCTQ
jgi:hypothetical protein